jgi:carbonic anhydrase
VTGVIVRSTANISSGAKTRLSAILHGGWIVATIVALEPLLRKIPLATLGGLLVFVGIRLVNFHHIRQLRKHNESLVYVTTLGGVVVFGLLHGIAIGVAVAVVRLLWRFTHVRVEVGRSSPIRVDIHGPLTFAGVPRLTGELQKIPEGEEVDIHVHSELLDHAGFVALEDFRENHERMGGKVRLVGDAFSSAEASAR